jgi:hypothetical protein
MVKFIVAAIFTVTFIGLGVFFIVTKTNTGGEIYTLMDGVAGGACFKNCSGKSIELGCYEKNGGLTYCDYKCIGNLSYDCVNQ